jgi:dTDP-4-dehydrorhamnose reductase
VDRREYGKQKVISRAIVVGDSGQVAEALKRSLATRGASILSTSSRPVPGTQTLDLASADSIRSFFRNAGPPAEVFLAGALTHVDRCEEERALCRRMNADGPALIAEECRARGHKLTFFSTEYVFGNAEYEGGRVGPFSEMASPAPASWYGECKLAAEREVAQILGSEALIVRTTMVFSWNPAGNNFLMQYERQLREIAEGKMPNLFRIPEDQISTPTYAPALAEDACRLRERGVGGVVNLVGRDLVSRRDLVERVIAELGFDRAKSLTGFQFLKTAELGQKARRPLTAGLTMGKAESLGLRALSLAEAFADVRARRGK